MDGIFLNSAQLPGGRAAEPAQQLAALYRTCGMSGALARIDGDFAVALHDSATGDVWLARDRVGVKPLYYWRRDMEMRILSF